MSHIKVVRNEGDSLTIEDSIGRKYLIVDMGTGVAISTETNAVIVASNKRQSATLDGYNVTVHKT